MVLTCHITYCHNTRTRYPTPTTWKRGDLFWLTVSAHSQLGPRQKWLCVKSRWRITETPSSQEANREELATRGHPGRSYLRWLTPCQPWFLTAHLAMELINRWLQGWVQDPTVQSPFMQMRFSGEILDQNHNISIFLLISLLIYLWAIFMSFSENYLFESFLRYISLFGFLLLSYGFFINFCTSVMQIASFSSQSECCLFILLFPLLWQKVFCLI